MNEERYEELTEELLKTIGKMRKELMWTRVFNGVLTVVMLAILVLGGVFIHKAQQYGEQVVEYVAMIDEYMMAAEPMLDELAKVDVEAINEAIETLDVEAINETFTSIDTESLNDTLGRLDGILDGLDSASERLKSVTEGIGGIFGWSSAEEEEE